MLIISVPIKEKNALDTEGTSVKINGHATTLRRVGDCLHYQDQNGRQNRCSILDEHQDGDLIRFTAASDGCEDEPHVVIRPAAESYDATDMTSRGNAIRKSLGMPPLAESERNWFWIALNGSSVALCPTPASTIMARPTPQQLIGFATLAEAKEAQRYLLTAPIERVEAKMQTWAKRIKAKEMAYHRPANPQPPTHAATQWIISPQAGGPS